jgi:uncharacterized protein YyaL (SSP411 family)
MAYRIIVILLVLFNSACMSQDPIHSHTNALIEESSPYLLQHAHNPVNWQAWNSETLERAKRENKLILISIGYSSCHWCHVMEKESFEDTAVARVMNEHYICIKVDREERPDVDQIYMNAVQLMTQRGGWPLNCVALPDGRPIWGGTYFPKDQWVNSLEQVSDLWTNQPDKAVEYADRLTEGVRAMELIERPTDPLAPSRDFLDKRVASWSARFDLEKGGGNRAPKFPLPTNYEFLLQYGSEANDERTLDHVHHTLEAMALGGIYDQIGGGWARYSTDTDWKVPHFEKMLYDNAQLIELYSLAYRQKPNSLYKEVVEQSIEFALREMYDTKSASFYSALDADSEGEEGAFYVWSEDELRALIPESEWDDFAELYTIAPKEKWEGRYILVRSSADQKFQRLRHDVIETLLKARSKRERPGLDDKSLTAWNAMMVSALVKAYQSFDQEEYLVQAKKTAQWILQTQGQDSGGLAHTFKEGVSTIDGFLDDYAFSAKAFLDLYEATFDPAYLTQANQWVLYCFDHFYSDQSGLFFYTSNQSEALVARSIESSDNVIPASNSVMAHQLLRLSYHLDRKAYRDTAKLMTRAIEPQMERYPEGYSNWLRLYMFELGPFYELALIGPKAQEKNKMLNLQYLPNVLISGSAVESNLPLLKNRYVEGKTLFYLCEEGACQLPTEQFEPSQVP